MAWRFIHWDRQSGVVVAEADCIADFKEAAERFLQDHGINVDSVEPREVPFGGEMLYFYQVPPEKLKDAA